MDQMRTYSEIENELWKKIEELPETRIYFNLYISDISGECIASICFSSTDKSNETPIMVTYYKRGDAFPSKPFFIGLDKVNREYYKSELRRFVVQYDISNKNYYTFQNIYSYVEPGADYSELLVSKGFTLEDYSSYKEWRFVYWEYNKKNDEYTKEKLNKICRVFGDKLGVKIDNSNINTLILSCCEDFRGCEIGFRGHEFGSNDMEFNMKPKDFMECVEKI